MEIIKDIKKGILQGIGIFLFFGLIGVGYVVFAVGNGDTLTADMWNDRNASDYDSGRVEVSSITSNNVILTHNLGVIPSDAQLYLSSVNDGSWAFSVPFNSVDILLRGPENAIFTENEINIKFFSGDMLIYCDANHSCPDGVTTSDSGYIRVLAWK